jgi:hypothetical protein
MPAIASTIARARKKETIETRRSVRVVNTWLPVVDGRRDDGTRVGVARPPVVRLRHVSEVVRLRDLSRRESRRRHSVFRGGGPHGRGSGRSSQSHDRDPDPGAARPPAVVALALDGHPRPRDRLDPRRPRGHHRRRHRRPPHRGGRRPRADPLPGRRGRLRLHRRRLSRRALLRPPRRPHRPQEAVHVDARDLPRGQRADRVLDEPRVVPRLPLHHRRRRRRRVLRHPFCGRRADPRARADGSTS